MKGRTSEQVLSVSFDVINEKSEVSWATWRMVCQFWRTSAIFCMVSIGSEGSTAIWIKSRAHHFTLHGLQWPTCVQIKFNESDMTCIECNEPSIEFDEPSRIEPNASTSAPIILMLSALRPTVPKLYALNPISEYLPRNDFKIRKSPADRVPFDNKSQRQQGPRFGSGVLIKSPCKHRILNTFVVREN